MRKKEDSTRPVWTPAELRSDEAKPRGLVTVSGIVHQHMEAPALLPWKLAARQVLDKLDGSQTRAFFVAQEGLRALTVCDGYQWRLGYASGADHLAALDEEERLNRAAFVLLDPYRLCVDPAEARARGMPLDEQGNGPSLSREQWEAVPAVPALKGAAGLLAWLRQEWVEWGSQSSCLDDGLASAVAMLETDAQALFGGTPVAAQAAEQPTINALPRPAQPGAADQQPQADSRRVEPEGGAWPHAKDKAWSDAERVAAFLMRHKNGMTGDEIAAVVEVSRQRIDQEIGKKRIDKAGVWLKGLAWQPSPALLAECGIKQAPSPLRLTSLAAA